MKKKLITLVLIILSLIIIVCTGALLIQVFIAPSFYVNINWHTLHLPIWVIISGVVGATILFLGGLVLLGAILAEIVNH